MDSSRPNRETAPVDATVVKPPPLLSVPRPDRDTLPPLLRVPTVPSPSLALLPSANGARRGTGLLADPARVRELLRTELHSTLRTPPRIESLTRSDTRPDPLRGPALIAAAERLQSGSIRTPVGTSGTHKPLPQNLNRLGLSPERNATRPIPRLGTISTPTPTEHARVSLTSRSQPVPRTDRVSEPVLRQFWDGPKPDPIRTVTSVDQNGTQTLSRTESMSPTSTESRSVPRLAAVPFGTSSRSVPRLGRIELPVPSQMRTSTRTEPVETLNLDGTRTVPGRDEIVPGLSVNRVANSTGYDLPRLTSVGVAPTASPRSNPEPMRTLTRLAGPAESVPGIRTVQNVPVFAERSGSSPSASYARPWGGAPLRPKLDWFTA